MRFHLLTDIIIQANKRYPKRRALAVRPKFRTTLWTYEDLFVFAKNVSRLLAEKRIVRGERVLLWASNSPYWLGIFFGCLLRGVIVVPLHTENTAEFIEEVARQTNPKLFFKSSDMKPSRGFAPPLGAIEVIDIDSLDEAVLPYTIPSEGDDAQESLPKEDDIVQILYTSGTTGDPKGVILTHKNIISNLHSVWDLISISNNDRILSILPLSHILEQIVEFRVLAAGAFIVYAPALSSSIIAKAMRKYKVTKMAVVPEFLKRIIARIEARAKRENKEKILKTFFSLARFLPARKLKKILFFSIHKQFGGKLDLIVSGGAPLEIETAKKWQLLGMRIIQGYGLTETSPVVSVLRPEDKKIESVGKAVAGVEVRIAKDGEILVRGPNVTQGYWNAPDKTRDLFAAGWLKTGDLGSMDEKGRIYIRGRKKFMILTASGQNVYPEDIEAELNKEDGVVDSAVVGLEKGGEVFIHAVILGDIKNPEALIERVNERLAQFQHIQTWSQWPFNDFPRTITRKVKRHEVLAYLEKTEIPAQMEERGMEAPLLHHIIGEVCGAAVSLVKPQITLVSLGLDSLSRIELLGRIEEEFGVEVDEALITPRTTVADLEAMVKAEPKAGPELALPSWPRSGFAQKIRGILYYMVVNPALRLIADFKAEGKENIASLKGPMLLMPNHRSDLDAAFVFAALPRFLRKKLAVAAAADVLYERFKIAASIVTLLFNSYPFSRKLQPKISLEHTGELLDEGWSILYFPEGGIPNPNEEGVLKRGTGLVAAEMGVPVVPVKIEGTKEIMPRGTHFPLKRGRVIVKFGKPLCFKKGLDPDRATKEIQKALTYL